MQRSCNLSSCGDAATLFPMLLMTALLYAVVRVSSCVKIDSDVSVPSYLLLTTSDVGEMGRRFRTSPKISVLGTSPIYLLSSRRMRAGVGRVSMASCRLIGERMQLGFVLNRRYLRRAIQDNPSENGSSQPHIACSTHLPLR